MSAAESLSMHGRQHCPGCMCEPSYVPVSEAEELVQILVNRYGSIRKAGEAYSRRYGLYQGEKGHSSGARLFYRLRHASKMRAETLDRIETMVAS